MADKKTRDEMQTKGSGESVGISAITDLLFQENYEECRQMLDAYLLENESSEELEIINISLHFSSKSLYNILFLGSDEPFLCSSSAPLYQKEIIEKAKEYCAFFEGKNRKVREIIARGLSGIFETFISDSQFTEGELFEFLCGYLPMLSLMPFEGWKCGMYPSVFERIYLYRDARYAEVEKALLAHLKKIHPKNYEKEVATLGALREEASTDTGKYSKGLSYKLSPCGSFYIVKGRGLCFSKQINIPPSHKDKPVREIAAHAFEKARDILTVRIPDSVECIGDGAFAECTKLTSVRISKALTAISSDAFRACASLVRVQLPETVTEIGDGAFSRCTSLTTVSLSKRMTKIGKGAFASCVSLSNISMPEALASLGEKAFSECRALKNLCVPCGVRVIEERAFELCANLTSIALPDGVETVGKCAFHGCSALTEIALPESVTKIDTWAFSECSSLSEIHIPRGVTHLGESAFQICRALQKVHLGENLKEIGISLFKGCDALQSIYYRGGKASWSKVKIGTYNDVLKNASLRFYSEVAPHEDGEFWHEVNGQVILWPIYTPPGCPALIKNEDGKSYSVSGMPTPQIEDVVIPESYGGYPINAIMNGAFDGNKILKRITIPGSVKTIGEKAFWGCKSLEKAQMGDGVKKIDRSAFGGCDSLQNLQLPQSLTSIEENAFMYCRKLFQITLPKGIKTIHDQTFYGCGSLVKVTFEGKVTSIGYQAFRCTSFSEVILPEGLKTIGEYAFAECHRLEGILLPKSLTHIKRGAFAMSNIYKIYYAGTTQTDWNKISIADEGNEPLKTSCVYYYMENEPSRPLPVWRYIYGGPLEWYKFHTTKRWY